jgi:hypothetical protein
MPSISSAVGRYHDPAAGATTTLPPNLRLPFRGQGSPPPSRPPASAARMPATAYHGSPPPHIQPRRPPPRLNVAVLRRAPREPCLFAPASVSLLGREAAKGYHRCYHGGRAGMIFDRMLATKSHTITSSDAANVGQFCNPP